MIGTIGVILDDSGIPPGLWKVTDRIGEWLQIEALTDPQIVQSVPIADFWPLA
jgi:hypothetical protein